MNAHNTEKYPALEPGSRRLWSLLDMVRFYAHNLLWVWRELSVLDTFQKSSVFTSLSWDNRNMIRSMDETANHLSSLGLRTSADAARSLVDLLKSARPARSGILARIVGSGNSISTADICQKAATLRDTINSELSTIYLLAVPADKKRYFESKEPLLPAQALCNLPPLVEEDVSEACKCFAVGRYTATVFHLMRALEECVKQFGVLLGVELLGSSGREKQWQSLLNDIEKELGPMDQNAPLTKRYAALHSNLYSVKLAWRNEVMHPKQTYTEEEAQDVLLSSKTFIRELASMVRS